MTDEPRLIRLLHAAGTDQRARENLLARLHGPILDYLQQRLRGSYERGFLEDMAIEGLVSVDNALDTCRARDDDQLLGWVLTVARNAAFDYLRSRYLGFGLIAQPLPPGGVAAPAIPEVERGRGDTILDEILLRVHSELSPNRQDLIAMRVFQRLTWSEIGRTLGISKDAAKQRFRRARATMAQEVRRRARDLPDPDRGMALSRLKEITGE